MTKSRRKFKWKTLNNYIISKGIYLSTVLSLDMDTFHVLVYSHIRHNEIKTGLGIGKTNGKVK